MVKDTKQQWFKDAKYGLFIHWGLYSILAGEYKGETTPTIAEWIMNTFDIPVDEYEKLASQFNPVNFDAESYVKFALDWGMKYITITSKHHDGFALFHSKCSKYNVVDATPYGKDIIGQFAEACKKYGMKLCLYYSQAQDWHHAGGYRAYHHVEGQNFRRYLDEKCLPQVEEILTMYGDIGMIWFDTPMGMTFEESKELFELVKSIQPNCIVSGRIGNNLGEYMTTGDNCIPSLPYFGDWEVPATLNDSWGYKKSDHNWKKPEDVIRKLVKIVSRGGNYLLNIGPDAMGNIPQESINILNRVGEFLKHNGDSIYGTRATEHYVYDVDNCLFTSKPHKLFIHLFKPMEYLQLLNIGNKVEKAYFLATGEEVDITVRHTCEGDSSWEFYLPKQSWPDDIDTVICVEIAEEKPIFEPLRE